MRTWRGSGRGGISPVIEGRTQTCAVMNGDCILRGWICNWTAPLTSGTGCPAKPVTGTVQRVGRKPSRAQQLCVTALICDAESIRALTT